MKEKQNHVFSNGYDLVQEGALYLCEHYGERLTDIVGYTNCDKIVESLNLTDNMKVALECRITGLSYPEIGRILARAQSTVFEYFVKMRQRYVAVYR